MVRLEYLGQYIAKYDMNHRDKKWFEDDVAEKLLNQNKDTQIVWQFVERRKNASTSGAVQSKSIKK